MDRACDWTRRTSRTIPTFGLMLATLLGEISLRGADTTPRLPFESFPQGRFEFAGRIGERIQANLDQWLLRAPQANPGMLEMFRLRDRQPSPQLVPWAGEFVGKYLISAVQALRMTRDNRLQAQVAEVVTELIATQAEDGYLGPFPKRDRLLKNWDLWGHYHVILALVMCHERTGDTAALAAARRAADLVCDTYLDTGRRVFDAGDPEMNMSILTALGMLHRITGEPRYLRLAREVERDWERAGDYLRAGLDGREFFESPRPRWESLHDLQGLVELGRITGEHRYRDAFEHHWRSIRRWDQRNTGGFSSGEQATGNPYAPTAIETCCTVAWMALTVDYLRLTGDVRAADALELATLNGGLGAQHPSGRWWTYNTPMDGVREASAHTIVFQARAGTPELNCCSVNAPRILGALSDWAVMASGDGLVLNSYLPATFTLPAPHGEVRLILDRDYPRGGSQRIEVRGDVTSEWTLRLRIPSWSKNTRITASFGGVPGTAAPGSYLEVRRRWSAGDAVTLDLDLSPRAIPGANEAAGNVSVYRGPLLLAYDQAANAFDEGGLPAIDLARLANARVVETPTRNQPDPWGMLVPWVVVDLPAVGGQVVRAVDFASAGARGTHYRSWLPATPAPAPPSFTVRPPDAARVPPGPTLFQWRGSRAAGIEYRVEFSADEGFPADRTWSTNVISTRLVLDTRGPETLSVARDARVWWRVMTCGAGPETVADVPPAWFRLDPEAPPLPAPPELKPGPKGELLVHSLRDKEPPSFGALKSSAPGEAGTDGTGLNGRDQMLAYNVPVWPEEDYTVAVRVRLDTLPAGRLGQIFSAWAAGMDDPLRLVIEGGKLYARIEAGSTFSTPGTPVVTGRWYAVAAVKRGNQLTLFVDGAPAGTCPAPPWLSSRANDCALGGNPHFGGNEFLAARFADFAFYARALDPAEVRTLATP